MAKRSILERYGQFEAGNPLIVLVAVLMVSVFLGFQTLSLDVETDFFKSLPQDLDAIKNQNLLQESFSQGDSLFILAKLNDERSTQNEIRDIRDPIVMSKLHELEELLRGKPEVDSVFGAPDILMGVYGFIPQDIEMIKAVFGEAPELFGKDNSLTTLIVQIQGSTEVDRIAKLTDGVRDDIESIGFPGSIKLTVTGGPLVGKIVFDLILDDLARTLSVAGILILLVLFLAYRNPVKGILAATVLVLAITWTAGTMSLLDIPLSVVTITLGALVIGIGIDYTIHVMNRYMEELRKKSDRELKVCMNGNTKHKPDRMRGCVICYGIAVDRVGRAIILTAFTTIASFLSLTLAGVPFLTHLGVALSLGIFYAMILSLFVLPALMILDEKITPRIKEMILS